MPYTIPTLLDFRTRFPAFDSSEDTQIEQLLVEASNAIDQSWIETDYQPAILYLTAHLLATDNSDAEAEVEVGGQTGAIAAESFGGLSVSYATGNSGSLSASEKYGSTEFGRRFLALLRANRGGPVAI
jgi:hypothetical protein